MICDCRPNWDAQVKVVLSARLMGEDQDAQGWLQRLTLPPGSTQIIGLERLTQHGVADVLLAMGNPLSALSTQVDVVAELHRLSEGDPLLVRLYVEALLNQGERTAFLTPEDLGTLDRGLGSYFDIWFEAQDRVWRQQGEDPLDRRQDVMIFETSWPVPWDP